MCLIVFAYNYYPGYQLVLAANRDEYYQRPTAPAHFWEECPGVLAGRDLLGLGTWLGVTRTGQFAALTNYRNPSQTLTNPRSRGFLVSEYLCGNIKPADYMNLVVEKNTEYNGYNLITGNQNSLWYHSNKQGQPRFLSPGLYGISNHLLDTPWPKVKRSKKNLSYCLQTSSLNHESLFELLADSMPADDSELPETGVDLEWERILSPVFITSSTYGTRSSTILTITEGGEVKFTERTYNSITRHRQDAHFTFQIKKR